MAAASKMIATTAGAYTAPAVCADPEDILQQILERPAALRQEQECLLERYEMLMSSCLGCGIRYDKDRVQTSPDAGDGRLADIADIERQLKSLTYYRQAASATIMWLVDGAGLSEQQTEMVRMRYCKPGTSLSEIARRLELGSTEQPNRGNVHRSLTAARRKMLALLPARGFVPED